MRTMKKALVALLVAMMILSVTVVQAQATSYKANKVTAKQIVMQLKKTGYIKNVSKPDGAIEDLLKTPNFYKSKYNFTDKKYKDVYWVDCTNASAKSHDTSVDGIHPTNYGYTLWAESVKKPILKILKK